MAQSPAHRFGQIIGEVLEAAVTPLLQEFAKRHDLYLDRKGPRPARSGSKCTWIDRSGNAHDLDFVLERGGTADKRGTPAAFIESAWRRYTKHSRNKAQEIQGAILPLAETYPYAAPFRGAVRAGVFTEGALTQLRSLGFTVLFFSYEDIVNVFRKAGMDASFDESTPDVAFAAKVRRWEQMPASRRRKLGKEVLQANRAGVEQFMQRLEKVVLRQIEAVVVFPLHGTSNELATVEAAIAFIEGYHHQAIQARVVRFEVQIRYSNGDLIDGRFHDKATAIAFLRGFLGPRA